MYARILKGNMGYDQFTVPDTIAVEPTFVTFTLALANICPWLLVPFSQISLKNSELKTTHNTSRDCRVHFFRQPVLEIAVFKELKRAMSAGEHAFTLRLCKLLIV